MKTSLVTVAAGAGFTSVLATGPYHEIRAVVDEAPVATELEVQFPDDAYAATFDYPAGRPIVRVGHGMAGILAAPANYFAVSTPSTGAIYFKVRDKSGTGCVLRLIESEVPLPAVAN